MDATPPTFSKHFLQTFTDEQPQHVNVDGARNLRCDDFLPDLLAHSETEILVDATPPTVFKAFSSNFTDEQPSHVDVYEVRNLRCDELWPFVLTFTIFCA